MYNTSTLVVYLDILFLLNLVMDYFIFWLLCKIINKRISRKRIFVGSFVAALIYCFIVIVPILKLISIWIYLILLPVIPIIIIFKPSTIKEFIQLFIMSNLTAIAIGGLGFALYYWVKQSNITGYFITMENGNFSIWLLLISTFGSYILIRIFNYYIKKRNIGIQKLYSLQVVFRNSKVHIKALLDTGNKVYDPITKYPVIIVEYKAIDMLLPEEIREIYNKKNEDITLLVQVAGKSEFGSRIRLIPYHSLGNPNGILLGFKADEVLINYEKGNWKSIQDVIIAVYNYELDLQKTYSALLHADFVSNV